MSRWKDLSHISRWFEGNGRPCNTVIEQSLSFFGVDIVEHLKALKRHEWDGMFVDATIVLKRVATRVFNSLMAEGELDSKECVRQLGFGKAPHDPTSTKRAGSKGKEKDDGTLNKLPKMKWKGFTCKVIKKQEMKRR